MEKHRPFLQRGVDVANVCANFVVTGIKQDNNTKLKMTHSPKSEENAFEEMKMRKRLRGLFINRIFPLVKMEFAWLFEPIEQWLNDNNVQLYANFVSGVTAGKPFWPRSHTDPDVWYTILVCIDYGDGIIGGGDFAFASIGQVLECKHGDVLVYNGLHHHGTTEFHLYDDEDCSGRLFFAFFMKKDVLHADLLSQAVVKRVGVKPICLT